MASADASASLRPKLLPSMISSSGSPNSIGWSLMATCATPPIAAIVKLEVAVRLPSTVLMPLALAVASARLGSAEPKGADNAVAVPAFAVTVSSPEKASVMTSVNPPAEAFARLLLVAPAAFAVSAFAVTANVPSTSSENRVESWPIVKAFEAAYALSPDASALAAFAMIAPLIVVPVGDGTPSPSIASESGSPENKSPATAPSPSKGRPPNMSMPSRTGPRTGPRTSPPIRGKTNSPLETPNATAVASAAA